jgi:hypothetical protein
MLGRFFPYSLFLSFLLWRFTSRHPASRRRAGETFPLFSEVSFHDMFGHSFLFGTPFL